MRRPTGAACVSAPPLSSGVLPSRQRYGGRALIRGRCPRLLMVVPSRHQSACGFYFITDFTDWTDFTVRGDCALMRPIGLGEYVTGICSRRVLAFPSDRLTHILPLAGHHKSTIITNDTHVLGKLLRSNQTDSMPVRSI